MQSTQHGAVRKVRPLKVSCRRRWVVQTYPLTVGWGRTAMLNVEVIQRGLFQIRVAGKASQRQLQAGQAPQGGCAVLHGRESPCERRQKLHASPRCHVDQCNWPNVPWPPDRASLGPPSCPSCVHRSSKITFVRELLIRICVQIRLQTHCCPHRKRDHSAHAHIRQRRRWCAYRLTLDSLLRDWSALPEETRF